MALVVVAAALAMSPNVADPDLWGHIQFGRDVLKDGAIAETTSYSYTAEGFRWINHENLSEIVMAVVANTFGPIGLVLGKMLLSLLVIVCVLRWNLANGTELMVASIMTLLVAANLGYHWSIRPQISSFVCFTLLILLLQYCFRGWRDHWHLAFPNYWYQDHPNYPSIREDGSTDMRMALGYEPNRLRFLWLVVPLFLVWGNSHGGFVAGLLILTAYLGLRSIEAIHRGGRLDFSNFGWGLARRMALMASVALLATLINPYGTGLHLWLIESLGSPRPEISDWSTSQLFTIVGAKLWLLIAVSVFALLASRKRHDATHWIVLSLLLWQSLSHFRHVPFFAIAAGFWIGPHLQSAMARFEKQKQAKPLGTFANGLLKAGLVGALLCISVSVVHRVSDLQVRRDVFPVDAIDYMRQNNLHGNLVVTYDWAQYAIAALCSEEHCPEERSRVAFDGRFRTCYPQQVVDMHFDFLYGRANGQRHRSRDSKLIDIDRVLKFGQPELVLIRRQGELTEKHMQDRTEQWSLLYQDAISQVWGRRNIFDNANHERYVAKNLRLISDTRCTDSITWPAIQPVQPQPNTDQPFQLTGGKIQ